MGDFALIWGFGFADLTLDDDDVAEDEGLRTAVLLSLFVDRRADDGDPLPGEDDDRRGHFGDEFLPDPDDKQGSRLWLLGRSKITNELRTRAELYIREALEWMISDGVVEKVGVETELVDDKLFYLITLERPEGDPVKFRFAHVWDGEAAHEDIPVITPLSQPRITETGAARITETGVGRVTEG